MVLAILCINLTAFAQNINLKLNNVTVKKAMETLKEGNGYSFVFASGDVDTQKVIQVDVQNGTVDQVIKQILHGQKVSYEIKNKNIIHELLQILFCAFVSRSCVLISICSFIVVFPMISNLIIDKLNLLERTFRK